MGAKGEAMFSVAANYLRHEGGTRFYETVLIIDKRGPAMLIRRWGKATDSHSGGGQTKVMVGSASTLIGERARVLEGKRCHRPGKGRYEDRAVGFGMHGLSASSSIGEAALIASLSHYSDPKVRERIESHFGLGADVDDIVAATGEDFIVEADEAPAIIERGESWGSW